jgi:hypothetical protein
MKNTLFLAVMAALIRVAAGQQISSLAGSFDSTPESPWTAKAMSTSPTTPIP